MHDDFNYSGERFADIQILRYRLNGFETLTLEQKRYIYYLAQAALCGRDITTDQFGKYNLRIRKLCACDFSSYASFQRFENAVAAFRISFQDFIVGAP